MRSHGVVCIEPPFTFYLSFSLSSKEGSITKQQSSDGAFFTAWMLDVIHTGGGTGLRAECWSVALLGRRVSEKHDCHLHCVLCTVYCAV